MQKAISNPISQAPGDTRPYAPSYIDAFLGRVQRLRSPYWLTFSVLLILHVALFHVVSWVDGWLPVFAFEPLLFIFPLWTWAPLAFITYLNSISVEALSSFSPLLDMEGEELKRLKDEFTTMPAGGVIASSIFWSLFYVLLTVVSFDALFASYGFGKAFAVITTLSGLVTFSVGSVIYYHSLRQLRLVARTVKKMKQVNLFRLDPVYAFSRLTARTGVAWMLLLSVSLLLNPMEPTNVLIATMLLLQVTLALAAFVLPLRFVNLHLVSEKRRLIAELNQRVERALERLHRCLDGNDLGEMEQLNHALTGLNAEREILTKIPTWPWRAGTLTSFLSAIVLPLILFLVQLMIQNLVGR